MTDSDGHLVDLASLVSKGPLELQPRAVVRPLRAGAASLACAYPEIVALGGEVVSIVPENRQICQGVAADEGTAV